MVVVDIRLFRTHTINLDTVAGKRIHSTRDFIVTERTLEHWIDLEDQRIGLVGVTQLPVPKGRVPASIELHGEYLCWSNPSAEAVDQTEIRLFPSAKTDTEIMKRAPVREMAPQMEVNYTGALDRFARLGTGEDVLRFARRYGVLDFCQHGLPDTHNPSSSLG